MLSRTAENIYWFGRHLQRIENTARLVNVHAYLSLDLPRHVPLSWGSLVEILGAWPQFSTRYNQGSESEVAHFLIADEQFPGSLRSTLSLARENLRATRETMPNDIWERVNELYALVSARGESVTYRRIRTDLLREVIDQCLMTVGMLVSNMSRGVPFQFLCLGLALEQADMTTRIIDVRSSGAVGDGQRDELTPFRTIQWMSVLKSLHAYQMYRREQRTRVSAPRVLSFLLHDRNFPRSVSCCLWAMQQTLPRLPEGHRVNEALTAVNDILQRSDVARLLADEDNAALGQVLDDIQLALGQVHNRIEQHFFQPD
ncbi:alpha-E domain-containing protein [Algiphilus sp.]|uniref:alpha-E domain-containing protein n=1 Tax=Algiphilus sp. TaxID=1872431 RepID=UPI002A60A4E0|nr:alpha-E domain-containing protein [Pseudomonadota bacterium]